MAKKIVHLTALCILLSGLFSSAAYSENAQDFGEYVVHCNALTTNFLSPGVAKTYGIKRSNSRGMINVSVLQKILGTVGRPVRVEITASATNLTGQHKQLSLREVREDNAIYYIGEFTVDNEETLDFDLSVTPEGTKKPLAVRFRQQFFTR